MKKNKNNLKKLKEIFFAINASILFKLILNYILNSILLNYLNNI